MSQLDLFEALAVNEATDELAALIAQGEQPGVIARTHLLVQLRAIHGPYLGDTARDLVPWRLWSIGITSPGARHDAVQDLVDWRTDNPGVHWPTLLNSSWALGAERGDREYRAACLGCDFEGPEQAAENNAVEDAHDHTHPWWRELPIVDQARTDAAPSAVAKAKARVVKVYEEARPGCTTIPACPVRTWRKANGTRHHTGGILGGYDLGVERAS